ncbi:hypothetical protein [Nocardia blacklockiae]|uniref:hypothetical protein n=1 Tax=Nocardia blacklockiae TaxID=480036 RepID=UPI001893089F|nr:hypothetical protein [Nocardia blacklockiae]MBF6171093.1 hypothetical protein [Nocardia blacklockiae]
MPELDPAASPVRMVAARAGRKGYRLEQASGTEAVPGLWHLLDITDGAPLVTGSLDQINAWLNS